MYRKPKCAQEVPSGMQINDQQNENLRYWWWWGSTAANEVLREIHNAVRAALKDFSRQGVFLYGPQQKCGPDGWVSGGLGYEASPAGRTVQTTQA